MVQSPYPSSKPGGICAVPEPSCKPMGPSRIGGKARHSSRDIRKASQFVSVTCQTRPLFVRVAVPRPDLMGSIRISRRGPADEDARIDCSDVAGPSSTRVREFGYPVQEVASAAQTAIDHALWAGLGIGIYLRSRWRCSGYLCADLDGSSGIRAAISFQAGRISSPPRPYYRPRADMRRRTRATGFRFRSRQARRRRSEPSRFHRPFSEEARPHPRVAVVEVQVVRV